MPGPRAAWAAPAHGWNPFYIDLMTAKVWDSKASSFIGITADAWKSGNPRDDVKTCATLQATASVRRSSAGTQYLFGAASGGRPPYSFAWDLGDGTTRREKNPVHNFSAAGSHTVKLMVTDCAASTASATISLSP